jgi:hypothetical protein
MGLSLILIENGNKNSPLYKQNCEKALSYFEDAYNIDHEIFRTDHPKIADDLLCIGIAKLQLGNDYSVINEIYFSNALTIYEKTLGRSHTKTDSLYNMIGSNKGINLYLLFMQIYPSLFFSEIDII